MADTELEIGAQTRAAGVLIDAIDPIRTALQDLATSLECAAGGFKGASAGGLATAVQAWFEVATELPAILDLYATKLVEVDSTEGRTDLQQREEYGRIATRLDGPQ
ncbi:hypothetical protein [Aeromicrobium sp. NPDC092404]|uniref:hypothetical protein n=1 Tax=Aeromicrobium sp. NPDC092404 TaxID=3154976 RepID=UPI00341CF75B